MNAVSNKLMLLAVAGVGLAGGSTALVHHFDAAGDNAETIPEVLILVHGFEETGEDWFKREYPQRLEEEGGFVYAGNLSLSAEGEVKYTKKPKKRLPRDNRWIFTVDLPENATVAIRESAEALSAMIPVAKRESGAQKVALVGYSIGGVVCRAYLTSDLYHNERQGEVTRLITISSPHLGTEFAALSHLYHGLKGDLEAGQIMKGVSKMLGDAEANSDASEETEEGADSGFAAFADTIKREWSGLMGKAESGVASLRAKSAELLATAFQKTCGVRIASSALMDLTPPGEGGEFLIQLNQNPGNKLHPHPMSVLYRSVVTAKNVDNTSLSDLRESLKKLTEGQAKGAPAVMALTDFIQSTMGVLRSGGAHSWEDLAGDGIVSRRSQNMENVPVLRREDGYDVESLEVQSSHLTDLNQKEFVKFLLTE